MVRLQRPQTLFLQQLVLDHGINLLVDVGANQGQYANQMRTIGYRGRICSYEPGKKAFSLLSHHARRDQLWDVFGYALGSTDASGVLNVSRDSVSSSLLTVGQPLVLAAPDSVVSYTEHVAVRRLDTVLHLEDSDRVWLKLDAQGSEHDILLGAAQVLHHAQVVQCEISLVPCYDGQAEYMDIFDKLHTAGLRLVLVEPGTQQIGSGEMLQFDGIFARDTPRS